MSVQNIDEKPTVFETRHLCNISVDTGCILVADPAYLPDAIEDDQIIELDADSEAEPPREDTYPVKTPFYLGFKITSGNGDGLYPVTAVIADGLVHSVTITFVTPE